ncbi:MAG TPA: SMC-Scp complex subunit ScpB [Candidatus Margulisiibacteriota bacterium]|nr:SMC-Scp complex subunit ScpB [Candidatus Margulisiibacteriota bacterium]
MTENNLKSVVEALLFSSEKPLTLEQLKKAMDNLDPAEIRRAVEDLKSEYEQSNRGMRLMEVAGGYQMVTSSAFASFLKKLYKERKGEKLSKPALETLAIIAYKQPITKAEIESLRSVNIDGVIGSLSEKYLVRIVGRKKAPGRPFVFGTTRQFLEHFGLKSLEDLPKMENFADFAAKQEAVEIETEGFEENNTVPQVEVSNGSGEVTQTN